VNFDPQTIVMLVLLIPSITFHEFMHGYAAYRLGDPTAKNAGRLTLNPIKSIDPIGTILLPLLMFISGGPIFGYAKPVPYNPMYFKNLRKGELITGFSGPLANFALALFGAALSWGAVFSFAFAPAVANALIIVGVTMTQLNLVLMFFNLIPIPPLDGSSIVPIFLPDKAMRGWYQIQRYSFVILIGLLWGLPILVPGLDPIGTYFNYTVDPLMRLLLPG
jgi:Zn-dependent protease